MQKLSRILVGSVLVLSVGLPTLSHADINLQGIFAQVQNIQQGVQTLLGAATSAPAPSAGSVSNLADLQSALGQLQVIQQKLQTLQSAVTSAPNAPSAPGAPTPPPVSGINLQDALGQLQDLRQTVQTLQNTIGGGPTTSTIMLVSPTNLQSAVGQLQNLQQTVQTLQNEVANPSTSSAALIANLVANLYPGVQAQQNVQALQTYLSQTGYFSGPITGIYGPLTTSAVKKLQTADGVPATGYFGPLTQAAVKSQIAAGGTGTGTGNGTSTPVSTASNSMMNPPGVSGSYNTGFYQTSFQYNSPLEGKKTLSLAVWYPTRQTPALYNYASGFAATTSTAPQPLTGLVALNAAVASGKFPLVIFSHADGGCALQSLFITETLAREGYVVAATNYDDANCGQATSTNMTYGEPYSQPQLWSSNTYIDRYYDTEAVLNQVLAMNQPSATANIVAGSGPASFRGSVDSSKIVAMGHSLGGYTVLGLAGAWPSWKDSRFKAVLAFSPYSTPFATSGNIGQLGIPEMLQGGTLDLGITPFLPQIYNPMETPKFFPIFNASGHFVWTDTTCNGYQTSEDCISAQALPKLILSYSNAFLDYVLQGKFDPALTTTLPGVSSYQYNINPATSTSPTGVTPQPVAPNSL